MKALPVGLNLHIKSERERERERERDREWGKVWYPNVVAWPLH